MKHYSNETITGILVVRTCDGNKALKVYFDDYNKSYRIEPMCDDSYDYYEDEYTEY